MSPPPADACAAYAASPSSLTPAPPYQKAARPILLAACGNLLAGDDAFGPMVLRAIETLWPQEAAIRQNVEIVDLSIGPAGLLDYLPERFGLVLIDAMQGKTGGEALLDVNCAEVEALPLALDSPRSSHGMGLGWQLRLAGQLALMPRHARLIALPIAGAEVGGGMSPGALEQVRPAAERAVRWCAAYATLWHAAGRAEAAT